MRSPNKRVRKTGEETSRTNNPCYSGRALKCIERPHWGKEKRNILVIGLFFDAEGREKKADNTHKTTVFSGVLFFFASLSAFSFLFCLKLI